MLEWLDPSVYGVQIIRRRARIECWSIEAALVNESLYFCFSGRGIGYTPSGLTQRNILDRGSTCQSIMIDYDKTPAGNAS
jgi:hypothetical protein